MHPHTALDELDFFKVFHGLFAFGVEPGNDATMV